MKVNKQLLHSVNKHLKYVLTGCNRIPLSVSVPVNAPNIHICMCICIQIDTLQKKTQS